MSSARIGNARRDAEVASSVGDGGDSTCKEPLNANVSFCVSGMSGEQDEVELSPECPSEGRQQCGTAAATGNACGFCLSSLSKVYIICSGCGKGFHPETPCVGVEEDVVSVLLKNKIGAINYCCCECRMVPAKGRGAGDVTAGYAQLLRVVGCLVNQVRGLVDSSSGDGGNVTNPNGPHVKVPSDINISRDAIFTEVRE